MDLEWEWELGSRFGDVVGLSVFLLFFFFLLLVFDFLFPLSLLPLLAPYIGNDGGCIMNVRSEAILILWFTS
jgi:hypothetical protein